ncbi:urease accessory protein UreD, partial [Staphylococcus aureus]|nr:urease accessory protein UreD [Staphylococcus aureus]
PTHGFAVRIFAYRTQIIEKILGTIVWLVFNFN